MTHTPLTFQLSQPGIYTIPLLSPTVDLFGPRPAHDETYLLALSLHSTSMCVLGHI